ncbi:Uncharacterised protein [Rodentibacter pneumotropicus]|uniref:Uncharacterized protein n=1 Tax=Rodentibacter pneumotropicus TaxID=758 RepID=A0A3S4U0Y6_9PAST|nr:Uncharacterised protein [Rodentibacter pneumotropicus]
MGNIRTHSHIKTAQTQSNTEPRFTLNELFPTSTNIDVRKYPKRVIAWGLIGDETVSVHIARVQSLGHPNWTLTDDCCPCPIEPSAVANVQHMPYKNVSKRWYSPQMIRHYILMMPVLIILNITAKIR